MRTFHPKLLTFPDKVKEKRKAEEEEDNTASPSLEIPGYAYNKSTHNGQRTLDSLAQHGVTNKKEITAILKLSDYGKEGTQIWITLSTTSGERLIIGKVYHFNVEDIEIK
ncbi:hypothetical protein [Bacteroides thetaiotaomicron]|uniref:hypothetical protein n=1 Tax=Bacteroides thetaiotaomicron TaxID=818 RepID=UPI001EF1A07C|nr:hypothetical protein [Bacteroides thetaiotaomicron]